MGSGDRVDGIGGVDRINDGEAGLYGMGMGKGKGKGKGKGEKGGSKVRDFTAVSNPPLLWNELSPILVAIFRLYRLLSHSLSVVLPLACCDCLAAQVGYMTAGDSGVQGESKSGEVWNCHLF